VRPPVVFFFRVAERYRWDDFLLDLDAYRLERAGESLSLEPKAFNLLVLMVRRPGHLFTKQEIFEAVWPDTAVTDHALTRVVAQLRRVLGDEAREARYLETVPTRGYRWIRPVELSPPEAAVPPPAAGSVAVPAATARLPRLAATAALASCAIAFLVWTQRSAPTSATAGLTTAVSVDSANPDHVSWPVQVTTHAGLDMQPALSPQGDAIAFVSDRTGALEIYVRALDGSSAESPLTTDGGQNVQPAWSPDGSRLAYHSNRQGGIWVLPSRGGTPKQVAETGSKPAWSPDGLRLAFQSDEHTDVSPTGFGAQSGSTIWMVDADGRHLRQLTRNGHPAGGHAAPAWSSDGRYLAFTVFEAGASNGVWILTLETGATSLLEAGKGLFESVFASDDAAVYVAGGDAMIVRVPFDPITGRSRGPRKTIPVPGVASARGATITPDGRRLAFAGLDLNSQIWAQRVTREGAPDGAAFPLTSDTSRRNSFPAISPDGSKVAYTSARRGELSNVWVMDMAGRNAIQLTPNDTADHKPNWFPDGKRVAYSSARADTRGIWSVDITTRREELLFDPRPAPRGPAGGLARGGLAELDLSPSMRQAAFSVLTPPSGRRIMYVTGLQAFSPRGLTDDTASVGYPAWSPDERSLAVEIKEGASTHAGVIDMQTGVLRRLTNERGQTWVRSWSPDGRKIAVAALRDGVWSLLWIEVATGRRGTITPAGPPRVYVRYPAWSPRGDLVLFERGELRGNIWMLQIP
jgi:Tol biopolymer transport system component/DNA-binding winged helix-turn-helix (wHTH) protein